METQEKLLWEDLIGLLPPALLSRADRLVQMLATIEQDAHTSCGWKTSGAGPKQIVMLPWMGTQMPVQGSASVRQVPNLNYVIV